MNRLKALPFFLTHSALRTPTRVAALLLLLAPGCTRDTPGYCTVDENCGRDQYCALPAQQCTTAVVLRALLSGDQVVPPTASPATGDFVMIVNEAKTSAHYTLNLAFAPPATTSTLLKAEILAGSVGQPNQGSLPLAAIGLGSLPSSGDLGLTADFLTGLRAGQYYVRITSSAFPTSGEIRGQIFSLDPADDVTTPIHLTGTLGGAQEAPAIVSPGVGTATVDFIESQGQTTLKYSLSGLSAPINGLHIHRGSFNVNGDMIYNMPVAGPSDFADTFSLSSDRIIPNQSHLFGLLFKSGLTYLNVHSTSFSSGELRAQLLPTAALPFNVPLTVPMGATATGSTGEAEFYWSADQTKLAFRIFHSVAGPTATAIVRPAQGMVKAVTLTCAALTSSAGVSGAQGYCDVDAKTTTAGTATAITAGDLTLGTLAIVVSSSAVPTGELAGQITLPKGM